MIRSHCHPADPPFSLVGAPPPEDPGGGGRSFAGSAAGGADGGIERTCELRGAQNGNGKIYATGSATLGGYFPGVDTFYGLQICAVEILDDLKRQGFTNGIGPGRSISQWWKWVRNKRI
jgi:hypothetical protein